MGPFAPPSSMPRRLALRTAGARVCNQMPRGATQGVRRGYVGRMFATTSLAASAALVTATALRGRRVHAVFLAMVLGVHLSVAVLVHARRVAWADAHAPWVRLATEGAFVLGAAALLAFGFNL